MSRPGDRSGAGLCANIPQDAKTATTSRKMRIEMPGEHPTSIVPGVQFRGLSFSARNHIFRCMQVRHLGAIEVQHSGPFALAIVAPDDTAA